MYAQLDSPLPSLTVSPYGEHCCSMRGFLGQDEGDPLTETLSFPDQSTSDLSNLPLTSIDVNEPLVPFISPADTGMIGLPDRIGTEFVSNGDGTYTNIQTGQSVPQSIAQQVTAATTGAGTANVQTQSTQVAGSIVDPNTGATIPVNNLTAAAQALNAAGGLVTAAGKLTAQGQALLNAGNLYNAPPSTGISAAMSSLTSWFTGSTMIAGVPNVAIIGGVLLAAIVLPSMLSRKKARRR